jgi:ferredoxin
MVILLEESPAPENHAGVREAALVCPAAAIRLVQS